MLVLFVLPYLIYYYLLYPASKRRQMFNGLFLVLSCPNFTRKTRNVPSRTMPSSTFFQTLNQHYQIDHVLICNDGRRSTKRRPLFLPILELGIN